jgi:predicted sugar kinase
MVPALDGKDCPAFGEAVFQFNKLAGDCFSAVQGGPFASDEIARLVTAIRKFGVSGVGQSSWGPTVFAIAANDEEAQRLVDWVRGQDYGRKCEITVARANNSGATIESGQ